MKFSLVVGTYNRVKDLEKFLFYLGKQTYKNFETIIVDQNDDGRLNELIAQYSQGCNIKYIHSNLRGLSRARNIGLKYISGDIIAFPDDDCWYFDESLLARIVDYFKEHPRIDGCATRIKEEPERIWFINLWKCKRNDAYLNKNSVLSIISSALFIRYQVVNDVGRFDEELGPGSSTKYGAGDESDYMIRVLTSRFSTCF